MNDWDILRWSEILEKYRDIIDVESLADDIEHYGSIRKAILDQSQKIKELRTEQYSREGNIDSLKEEEERIEKSIAVLEEKTLKTIERLAEAQSRPYPVRLGKWKEPKKMHNSCIRK